jgi:hypothetical protein
MNALVWATDGCMQRFVPIAKVCSILYLLLPSCGLTAPLGLPDNTAKIGYSIGTASISVDDPDGSTEDNWATQPFTLIYTDWFIQDIRQWSELYYFETALDADATRVGQNVERYGVRFSLQKSYRLTQSWSPWFGAGLDLSNTNYNTRHTKDADGFLIEAFDDRDETNVSLLFNILSEWSLRKDWTIGAKLQQLIPASGDISEFSAAMTILYRY